MNQNKTIPVPLSIVRLEVERLFGRYSYVLPASELNQNLIYSPFILYGDNGSGKTTLLKLLFHLLSPKQKHRRFIAQTPFVRFSVFLADGKRLLIKRQEGKLLGAFKLQLFQGTEEIAEATVETDNQKLTPLGDFYQKLSEIQLNVFFIGDNRIIESDLFDEDESENELAENANLIFQKLLQTPNTDRDSSLKRTLQRFEEWVRQEVISGTHQGASSVNSIYEDIAAQIINAEIEDSVDSTEKLIAELKHLETRSLAFYQLGLIEPLAIQKLINTLQSSGATQSMTWKVLKPYVESVAARLDALENIKALFNLFVKQINQFFGDKQIQLQVREGLKITTTDSEQALSPQKLSSGEKQLLLLFCNTLIARDKATIFIIDEPEISLNIKWQRQLIRTLLNFTKDSQVQFLLATHSIELLSQYRSHVVKLSNVVSTEP
ncbi:MAG TPA: ATP-binding protein [Thiotrichaceae bacterium]|nr:ATP-binding protein [Thiotrichaceae bacterium]